jgi:signal peptidase I
MPLDIQAIAGWAADALLSGSLQGGIVIALVWLVIRRVPRVPPGIQAALWWLAALKLLLTVLPVPVISIALLPAQPIAIAGQTTVGHSDGPVNTPTGWDAAATSTSIAGQPDRRWLVALVLLWVSGLAVLGIRLVMAHRALGGVVRRSLPAPPEDLALVRELAPVFGLRSVPRVRLSAEIESPQVVGIGRPCVLLPSTTRVRLTPDERAMVLGHELVHIRRHDLALGWVPALAERLFFFHPLAVLASREYITAREAACDAAVVRALAVSPGDYGDLLVRSGVVRPASALAAGGASSSLSSLKRRLEMLQNTRPVSLPRRAMWATAAIVLAALMPFHLVAKTPADRPQPEAAVAQDADQRREIEALRRALAEREEAVRKLRRDNADRLQVEFEAIQRLLTERQLDTERDTAARKELLESQRRQDATREQFAATLRRQGEDELAVARARYEELLRHYRGATELQSRTYAKGDLVTLVPDDKGTRPPDSRVLAVPGDRIEVAKSRIAVNGVPVTELSADFLAGLPDEPWNQTVPAGHYFVAAEQRSETGVTRFWGLIPSSRIAGRH